MNLLAKPGVVVRIRMDEAVERVHHFPIAHDDDAHGADAAGAAVGGFEIDTNEVGYHNQQKYGILTRTTFYLAVDLRQSGKGTPPWRDALILQYDVR